MNLELKADVSEGFSGNRLDRFLKYSLGDEISRATIQKWIEAGYVQGQDGKILDKSSWKVKTGEKYLLSIPPKPPLNLEPIPMELPVILERENFLIIHKPSGIASHSGPGDRSPSLVNGLIYHFKELSKMGGEARPGIVHRLDKPTEGLILIAKNDRAHGKLSELFRKREIEKKYYAWVQGHPPEESGTIDLPIARHPVERLKMTVSPKGRRSITHYKVLKYINSRSGRKFSFIEVGLETGRTHQIRVHFQNQRCPVVGDLLYSRAGSQFESYGLQLLSYFLKFKDPFTNEKIEAILPLSERFLRFEKNAPLL
ncbi:pseudouridine synthase, RluA family [Leptospira interrogans str. 2003000735]|uniref:Pseudouridine synthase n=2 Tax=Leptospira interrogans TaxID=173 RepID=A0A829D7H0_LEPIR|nr:RluA family pseudouridine synthase [Leptospira interrogans]EMY04156.1 pseudouridine synthase, RluA family [Leptospira interrogans str. 2002000626]EMY23529.1 pseudouridine synthase, RluA family [Leptospira interrogans serovar Australis str. 200703203]EKN86652.1 pseudouridine synthase, RluA family [Leptospira interrogans str. 2002000624]EKQ38477.1 pseudouridine synthase, RluA family [Leptospira interrogans str. 2002000621]EKQ48783.1 pseudouridine synthase, RluA family [Leptospira interrogans 